MILHDISAAAAFAAGFLALFAIAERLRRRDLAPPEAARKLVHVGGCLGAMLFPFAFRSPWSVVALALVFSAGIGAAQRVWRVRSLDDVGRASDGGLLHPLALGACYLVSDTFGRVADYEIAMAVLAFSDSAAAGVDCATASSRDPSAPRKAPPRSSPSRWASSSPRCASPTRRSRSPAPRSSRCSSPCWRRSSRP